MSHASGSIFFDDSMVRDMQAANEVRKLQELGRYKKEFTVYGTVYWDGYERKYLISSSAIRIYEFIYQEKNLCFYPTPIEVYTVWKATPSGCEEEIRKNIKIQLARKLQNTYSEEYFKACDISVKQNNQKYDTAIIEMLETIEDAFDEERLKIFQFLLEKSYYKGCITEKTYYDCQRKVNRLEKQMETKPDFSAANQKEFYGFCILDKEGRLQYRIDANQELIYQQMDNSVRDGCLVSPIYKKNYMFQFGDSIAELRKKFLVQLQHVFYADYMKLWKCVYQEEIFIQKNQYLRSNLEQQSWVWLKKRWEYSTAEN